MLGIAQRTPQLGKDYASCSGCSLECLLVCPVWRRATILTHPLGRAKALQHGASAADIAVSIELHPVRGMRSRSARRKLHLVAMTLGLRRQLPQPAAMQALQARMDEAVARPLAPRLRSAAVLLPGQALRKRPGPGAGGCPVRWRGRYSDCG
jgi:hypothetical protein